MRYDTAGNLIIFYDMCGYCDLDTGGNHRHWCPCYQPFEVKSKEQLLAEISERSHIKYGVAWQYLADH